MKKLVLALAAASLVSAQVATHANERYRSKEGREAIAKTLGDPHRDSRQKPEELVRALTIQPGMTVADLGTGIGYMLPFLSRAVGAQGRVVAQDIFGDFLDQAKKRAADSALTNVSFVLGTDTDPKLEKGSADLVLILDAYHHFDYPEKMLDCIREALKERGRLAIVDFYKSGFRDPAHIRLDEGDVIKEVQANGFRLRSSGPLVEKTQYIALFERE
jgi:ubiquinone/menaquinone biosynthesis C-methylase UbiE